jgi:hypothetical protein
MSTEICVTCRSYKKEKSWQSDAKGKPLNRCTVEFSVDWEPVPEDGKNKANSHEGSTLTLSTMNEKEAERYKIGKKYTLTLKPE